MSRPWGGEVFGHLLMLFSASFLATVSIILGAWFLVFRPATPEVAPEPPTALEEAL